MSTIKLDKTSYASLIKTSGEMLDSILEQVKADMQGTWNYSNAQALGQLSEDLAAMGKPLKLCQSLKGLSMLSTAPWSIAKPEQVGKTVYQFSRLGYQMWASPDHRTKASGEIADVLHQVADGTLDVTSALAFIQE